MDRPRRRRLSPEARKREIVEVAERLIAAQGASVRAEDVAREAGVAKGTLFFHFPTWDDLLETVRQRLVGAFDAAHPLPAGGVDEGPTDWPALVETQAEAFIDFTLSRRGFGEAVFHSDFAERRPLADNGIQRLSGVIRAGQADGAFGPVDPAPTARLLFAAIHESADALAAGADRAATLAALRALLRRALAP
ncbi:TetR/AcrR family transcriptional regulator [Caulobacter sp. KR2-114]|uniref:TetR/AcrR family transcriptional regulator n=1 Tax=Caulobacter sp. KR2-114 TaxID=3400912 RepID=UPI003BFB3647